MNQLNCRNCGAPHNGKCNYCGTIYDLKMAPKIKNKSIDSLSASQKTMLAIGLAIVPLYLYKKVLNAK